MATKINGYEMLIEMDGKKLGCLSNISYSLERAIVDASCRELGNFTSGTKGPLSGSIDFDGLIIIDEPVVATNMRSNDLMDLMLDDSATEIAYVFGPGTSNGGDAGTLGIPGDIPGSKVLSGNAILSGLTLSGSSDGLATYSGTMVLTSKPTHVDPI